MKISELIDKATRLRSESTAFSYNDLTGDDRTLEELASLWITAQEWATAARAVEKAIGAELVSEIGKSETARPLTASGYLVYLGIASKEECIDEDGFFDWLHQNPSEIQRAFNPNTARKGSIPPAVRSTFFEKVHYGEPRMQAVPVEVLAQAKSNRERS